MAELNNHVLPGALKRTVGSQSGGMTFARSASCSTPFRPLADVGSGVHYFVVCICAEEQTWNIIPHKYLVEPSGKLGADNFYGWNREEREDFNRLMVAREFKPGEEERLRQIQAKGGPAMHPPRESLYPLVRALPFAPRPDSAAVKDFADWRQRRAIEEIRHPHSMGVVRLAIWRFPGPRRRRSVLVRGR
jgi:hypothetical protein